MSADRHDPEWDVLLHGFVDDELDAANALRCEQHIATCPACAGELARLVTMRQRFQNPGIAWTVPEGLRQRVIASIEQAEARRPWATWVGPVADHMSRVTAIVRRWSLVPSLAVLAAAIVLFVARPQPGASVEDEIVAGHVRSLLASHLTDVATSNQHVVKPWFNGRIDFSPPVVDLAARGFPLVGGRVDYVGGRVVAALVYRRNGHTINLFVWPGQDAPQTIEERDGYNLASWSEGGLTYWAVSDLNADELRAFKADFARATRT
jgi:anti-sigma factor RsiW